MQGLRQSVIRLKGRISAYLLEVAVIKSSPHSIALGFAVGTLIGILPTPGISFITGGIVILMFKSISKISLFAALVLFNPFVNIPFDIASYKLGNYIFQNAPVHEFTIPFLNTVYRFTRRYLVGNAIIAVLMSILSYFMVKKAVVRFKK
ncbi:MAG: DUF2062 domain-containing protein [archaeon]